MSAPKMTRTLKAGLLFSLFALCAFAFLAAHKFRAHLPTPAPRELFAIVNAQLVAFRSDDFQGAYRCAATGVQHKFTLAQFEKMVRVNYPEFTRTRRVEFGLMQVEADTAQVEVFFFAADDSVRSFLYSLIREDDSWRINGVEELRGYPASDHLLGTHA